MRTQDAKGGVTTFARDAGGNLVQTTDPNGNVISVAYDRLGRCSDLRDPDLGWIHEDVDPLGQVWRRVAPAQRAAGTATRMEYDELGCMTGRYEPDLESHWVYDGADCAAARSCGQLVEAHTGPATQKDYRRTHSYDSLGRPSQSTQTLDVAYRTTTDYDTWGRLSRTTHQRGSHAAKAYDHRYNDMGYAARLERAG